VGIKILMRQEEDFALERGAAFRKGLLSEAIESLLSGEVTLGKELLRDYINATVGFPKLAGHTKIHAKTLHHIFGPNGNPTANNLLRSLLTYNTQKASDSKSDACALLGARLPDVKRLRRFVDRLPTLKLRGTGPT
jgi:hypothetical protein